MTGNPLDSPYRPMRSIAAPDAPCAGTLAVEDTGPVLLVPVESVPAPLWTSPAAHVWAVADVLRRPDGHDAVLPWCSLQLDDALEQRSGEPIHGGEAVTILVSLLRGSREIESRGLQHVAGSWWLTHDGSPTWVPGTGLPASVAARAIARTVADRCGDRVLARHAVACEELWSGNEVTRFDTAVATALEHALFAACAPQPILLAGEGGGADGRTLSQPMASTAGGVVPSVAGSLRSRTAGTMPRAPVAAGARTTAGPLAAASPRVNSSPLAAAAPPMKAGWSLSAVVEAASRVLPHRWSSLRQRLRIGAEAHMGVETTHTTTRTGAPSARTPAPRQHGRRGPLIAALAVIVAMVVVGLWWPSEASGDRPHPTQSVRSAPESASSSGAGTVAERAPSPQLPSPTEDTPVRGTPNPDVADPLTVAQAFVEAAPSCAHDPSLCPDGFRSEQAATLAGARDISLLDDYGGVVVFGGTTANGQRLVLVLEQRARGWAVRDVYAIVA